MNRRSHEARRVSDSPSRAPGPHVHPWRLPSLSAYLFLGLNNSFLRWSEHIAGPQLFAMFLLRSACDIDVEDKFLQLRMLRELAKKGYIPAQAVVGLVHESYGMAFAVPSEYLYNGASSGSLHAITELTHQDSNLAHHAREKFQEDTGYNQFFSPLKGLISCLGSAIDNDGNTILHQLAARGLVAEMKDTLLDPDWIGNIDARNRHGETALYKACLSGRKESVVLLCQSGADASLESKLNSLTCLHWLFNFLPGDIEEVLTALLSARAVINAKCTPRPLRILPDHHFPFRWPLGTPLHSAVHARSHTAIKALVTRGADAGVRDIRDPYLVDENVRQMHVHGGGETGETSEPQPGRAPSGFTPADLAAALHDSKSLECLAFQPHSELRRVLHSLDEEGYTPVHRLSYSRTSHTSEGIRYWSPAFRGPADRSRARLLQTVRTLEQLGGDINLLTRTPAQPALLGVNGLSPLMIAATKVDLEAASVLVQAGSCVNQRNRSGRTALECLPASNSPDAVRNAIPQLLSLLAYDDQG
jgi:ankyrin repeat protein